MACRPAFTSTEITAVGFCAKPPTETKSKRINADTDFIGNLPRRIRRITMVTSLCKLFEGAMCCRGGLRPPVLRFRRSDGHGQPLQLGVNARAARLRLSTPRSRQH